MSLQDPVLEHCSLSLSILAAHISCWEKLTQSRMSSLRGVSQNLPQDHCTVLQSPGASSGVATVLHHPIWRFL